MSEPDKDLPNHLESFLSKHPQLVEQVVELVQWSRSVTAADSAASALLQASSSPGTLEVLQQHNRFYPDSLRSAAAMTMALAIIPERLGTSARKVGWLALLHFRPRLRGAG